MKQVSDVTPGPLHPGGDTTHVTVSAIVSVPITDTSLPSSQLEVSPADTLWPLACRLQDLNRPGCYGQGCCRHTAGQDDRGLQSPREASLASHSEGDGCGAVFTSH